MEGWPGRHDLPIQLVSGHHLMFIGWVPFNSHSLCIFFLSQNHRNIQKASQFPLFYINAEPKNRRGKIPMSPVHSRCIQIAMRAKPKHLSLCCRHKSQQTHEGTKWGDGMFSADRPQGCTSGRQGARTCGSDVPGIKQSSGSSEWQKWCHPTITTITTPQLARPNSPDRSPFESLRVLTEC